MANNLITRDPFDVIRQSWGRMFDEPFFRSTLGVEEGTLPLDISQTDKEIVVRASLPGYAKEDVEVSVHNGVLSIKAERKGEEEEKSERFYRRERWYGSVSRRIALPGVVEEAETSAELKDGVLTLRVPLGEKAKPRSISIN